MEVLFLQSRSLLGFQVFLWWTEGRFENLRCLHKGLCRKCDIWLTIGLSVMVIWSNTKFWYQLSSLWRGNIVHLGLDSSQWKSYSVECQIAIQGVPWNQNSDNFYKTFIKAICCRCLSLLVSYLLKVFLKMSFTDIL